MIVVNKEKRLIDISSAFSFQRCLADSNRRRRFCRPLTKPLIQGTISQIGCKGSQYFRHCQIFSSIFCDSSNFFLSFVAVLGLLRYNLCSQNRDHQSVYTPHIPYIRHIPQRKPLQQKQSTPATCLQPLSILEL